MNGDLPAEVWDERDIAATLSPHDLGSDTRAVELVCVTGPRTHALTSEGADASEDGTPIIAATLTGGGAPNSNPPGRRQEDDTNLVAFDPKAGGDGTSSGAFEEGTGITPTLGGARPHAVAFSHTAGLDCQPSSSVAPTVKAGHDTMPSVATETTVRRLTPTECERLQGVPDNHTLTSNGKPQADSARYRQMGNGGAVPVFVWVFTRIVQADS